MINTKFTFVKKKIKNAEGPIEGLVLERIVFMFCLRKRTWNCSKFKKFICLFSAQIIVIFESNKLNKVM